MSNVVCAVLCCHFVTFCLVITLFYSILFCTERSQACPLGSHFFPKEKTAKKKAAGFDARCQGAKGSGLNGGDPLGGDPFMTNTFDQGGAAGARRTLAAFFVVFLEKKPTLYYYLPRIIWKGDLMIWQRISCAATSV